MLKSNFNNYFKACGSSDLIGTYYLEDFSGGSLVCMSVPLWFMLSYLRWLMLIQMEI